MNDNSEILFIEKNYEEVGRLRPSTKQKFIWNYKLGGIYKEIKFLNSVNSGKKLIMLDGNIIYDQKFDKKKIFSHEFTWQNFEFTIQQNQKSFELIVHPIVQQSDKFAKFNNFYEEKLGENDEEYYSLNKQEIIHEYVGNNNFREEQNEELKKQNILQEKQLSQPFKDCQFLFLQKILQVGSQDIKRKLTSINVSMHKNQKENAANFEQQQQQPQKQAEDKDLLEMNENINIFYTPQDEILRIYEEQTKEQQFLREQESKKDRLSALDSIQYSYQNNQFRYQQNPYGWNQNQPMQYQYNFYR